MDGRGQVLLPRRDLLLPVPLPSNNIEMLQPALTPPPERFFRLPARPNPQPLRSMQRKFAEIGPRRANSALRAPILTQVGAIGRGPCESESATGGRWRRLGIWSDVGPEHRDGGWGPQPGLRRRLRLLGGQAKRALLSDRKVVPKGAPRTRNWRNIGVVGSDSRSRSSEPTLASIGQTWSKSVQT